MDKPAAFSLVACVAVCFAAFMSTTNEGKAQSTQRQTSLPNIASVSAMGRQGTVYNIPTVNVTVSRPVKMHRMHVVSGQVGHVKVCTKHAMRVAVPSGSARIDYVDGSTVTICE